MDASASLPAALVTTHARRLSYAFALSLAIHSGMVCLLLNDSRIGQQQALAAALEIRLALPAAQSAEKAAVLTKIGKNTRLPPSKKAPTPSPTPQTQISPPPLAIPMQPEEAEKENDPNGDWPECSDSFGEVIVDLEIDTRGEFVKLDGEGKNASQICVERLLSEIRNDRMQLPLPQWQGKGMIRIGLDLGPQRLLLPQ